MLQRKFMMVLAINLLVGQERIISNVNAKEETISCVVDQDCKSLNEYYICMPVEDQDSDQPQGDDAPKECIHKPLFPLETKEIVGTFVFSVIMCLSNVAGIGGGGVAIPLAMTFFNFSLKPAIAVSSFSIMISTLARFFFNFGERHPEKPNCVSIDYNMTNVMMPMTLLGSLIGAYVYVSFPDLVLQIILTLLLLILTVESGKKGIQIYKKESASQKTQSDTQQQKATELSEAAKDLQEQQKEGGNHEMEDKTNQIDVNVDAQVQANDDDDDEKKAVDTLDKEKELTEVQVADNLPDDDTKQDPAEKKMLDKLINQEKSHGQWKKQFLNLSCLVCIIVMSLLRGGKSEFSFQKCSVADWVAVACFSILMIVIVFSATKLVAREQALKEKYDNINLVDSDLKFRGTVLRNILALAVFGGWVAGALGLGGGAIFNPILLNLGVPPKVSSATGMYLITFSKIAACLIYFIFGELQMDYSLWIAGWSTIGALIGLKGVNWYMDKFGRQSIIVFTLTFILGISTIGVPIFGGLDLYHKHQNGESITSFKSIC